MSYLDRTIYDDAVELVDGDRSAAYGDPNITYENVAQAWNGILRAAARREALDPAEQLKLTAYEVFLMLATMKIIRAAFKPSRDNFVDAGAYIGLAKMADDNQAQHPAAQSLKPPKVAPSAAPTATPDSGCGNGKIPGYDDPCPKPRSASGSDPKVGDPCFDTECYRNGGRCAWAATASAGMFKHCYPR
jgi:hypothetical protein